MSLACVWSTRSVPATLGLPLLAACVLSRSTLLRLQAALQGVGPELCALPRSKPLRFRFPGTPQRRRLGWACVLCPHRSELLRPPGAWRAQSPQVGGAPYHLPGPSRPVSWVAAGASASGVPCVSSGELISGCDPPSGCQLSRIPRSRLATGSLLAVW